MELKDLCDAVVEKMKELKNNYPDKIILENGKHRTTLRMTSGTHSQESIHLVVDTKHLTITGTVKKARLVDDFVAKIDIKKRLRIYNHNYPIPDFWKQIHELLNKY